MGSVHTPVRTPTEGEFISSRNQSVVRHNAQLVDRSVRRQRMKDALTVGAAFFFVLFALQIARVYHPG